MTGLTAFALASVLHAGFQLTVTLMVYPVLAETGAEAWSITHERHSRRIVPIVGAVYGGLVMTGAWLVVDGPSPTGWLALALALGAVVVTAALAAPTHGRLTTNDPQLVHRLLVVDRVRCGFAVLGAAASVVAVAAVAYVPR